MDSPRTFGDVEGFINMLLAACEDEAMNETLQILLAQPDERRKAIVHRLLDRLRERSAPQPLIDAMACLLDDEAAEKAYEAIYKCGRTGDGR
jgi:Trp operon repressor